MTYQLAMNGSVREAGSALQDACRLEGFDPRHVRPPRCVGSRARRERFRSWAAGNGKRPGPQAKETVVFTVEVHPNMLSLVRSLVDDGVVLTAVEVK